MTAALSSTHFLTRAAHECERRMFGDACETVPQSSVLVVEDNADMRVCFRHLFRMHALISLSVEMADSKEQAMAMIVTRCYDMAVLDFQLGSSTATDLVRTWREYDYELPFVVVSGYPDVEQEAMAIGASGFIHKTELTPDNLARSIRKALDNYWTVRARR